MTQRNEYINRVVITLVLSIVFASPMSAQSPTLPKKDAKEGLSERLIRRAKSGGKEDVMVAILRLMADSVRKLEMAFDPGPETQAVQQQVLDRLNEAINSAASQRRPRRQRPHSGDKRRRASGEGAGTSEDSSGLGSESSETSTGSRESGARAEQANAVRGDLRETRRPWGNLPQREREELIQGSTEASLERFRKWIEQYYKALQESRE